MLRRQLPWVAVLATLATAVLVLFGPLWSSAAGDNPLMRAPGPDWTAIRGLATPTLLVLASAAAAVAGPRSRVLAGLAVAAGALALREAPGELPLWFAPALVLTALAWVWGLVGWRKERPSSEDADGRLVGRTTRGATDAALR